MVQSFEEWKEENPIKVAPGFEESCIQLGLDPEEEIDKILETYYEEYLMQLETDE